MAAVVICCGWIRILIVVEVGAKIRFLVCFVFLAVATKTLLTNLASSFKVFSPTITSGIIPMAVLVFVILVNQPIFVRETIRHADGRDTALSPLVSFPMVYWLVVAVAVVAAVVPIVITSPSKSKEVGHVEAVD